MATRQQIKVEFTRNLETVIGRISATLVADLRDATPRDTAYHSSRWVGRIGGPPATRTTPPTRSGRAAALSFAQQSASIAAFVAYKLARGSTYVQNDGNYISKLNQREGDFIQKVVNNVARKVSLAGTTLR